MKKRMISLLAALALCLGFLPGAAEAVNQLPADFYLSIGGTAVTEDSNLGDLLGDGTVSVAYSRENGLDKWTIHLNQAELTDSVDVRSGLVELVLTGDNRITTAYQQGKGLKHGIWAGNGILTVTGGGSLTIDVEAAGGVNPASAISVGASGALTGGVKIQGISSLVLKGCAHAITCVGALEITGATLTASNLYSAAGNPVLSGGIGVTVSNGSQVRVSSAEGCDGISAPFGDVLIQDSSVESDCSHMAVYAGNRLQISNSQVDARSAAKCGLYADYDNEKAILITQRSTVHASSEGDWPGIYTPGELDISDSEVTASSPSSNAINTGYGIFADGSTVRAETESSYPAVYTDDLIRLSDSTVNASSENGSGMYSMAETAMEGASSVTAAGAGPGLIANGGLTVKGGTVDAVSTESPGFFSANSLTLEGGSFHAKGGPGRPAVCLSVTDEEAYKGDYSRDTSRITLADGLSEISGGVPAVSDWYDVGEGYWRFVTSFVSPGTQVLEEEAVNGLNEVTVCAAKADYAAVNAAIAKIPPDLSGYTDASAAALNRAREAVVWDLPGSRQADVDGFARAIEEALAGLVPKTGTTHTIRFLDGGLVLSSISVPAGGRAVPPAAPVKAGCQFAGWYKDAGGTIPFDFNTAIEEDLTLYAKWTPSRPSGSSGGSSSGGGGAPSYKPAVKKPAHGTVTVSPSYPKAGDQVLVKPIPDRGYQVDGVTVTGQDGSAVPVTERRDGVYTFTQPRGEVTVEVELVPDLPGSFRDVPGDAWYSGAVRFVSGRGLMGGYDGGLFQPDRILTRAQLAQILYNHAGRPVAAGGKAFPDVASGSWCAEAVGWASSAGVANGYGDGLFRPDAPITREQLAVMLWRYAGRPAPSGLTLEFTDAAEISGFALDALRWAVGAGVLSGYGGGMLAPKAPATRAQTAQMLKNYLEREA